MGREVTSPTLAPPTDNARMICLETVAGSDPDATGSRLITLQGRALRSLWLDPAEYLQLHIDQYLRPSPA